MALIRPEDNRCMEFNTKILAEVYAKHRRVPQNVHEIHSRDERSLYRKHDNAVEMTDMVVPQSRPSVI